MKKILIFTNEFYPFKGGIGRYCEEVINEAKKDFNITLVAPEYDGSLKKTAISKGINLNLFKGGQFKYWHIFKLINKVRTINYKQFDNVLVADWPFWIAIEFVNRYFFWKKNINYSLMLHGSEVLNLKNGKASIFTKLVNIFSGVRKVFTNSQYTKDIFFENHNVPSGIPVEVTYLGVSQQAELSNLNYKNNLKNDELNILSVGRLDDRKGNDLVIRAIGLISDEIKDKINYTIVGNGTEDFKKTLYDLAVKNNVKLNILSGTSDAQLEEIYMNNNVFVLAAKHNNKKIEGFGLVFLEAAKFGIPSIGTDVGAVKEVVKDNKTGLVVKENIDDISKAIIRCYNDKEMLSLFSDNCIADVKNYKWATLVEKTFRGFYG